MAVLTLTPLATEAKEHMIPNQHLVTFRQKYTCKFSKGCATFFQINQFAMSNQFSEVRITNLMEVDWSIVNVSAVTIK